MIGLRRETSGKTVDDLADKGLGYHRFLSGRSEYGSIGTGVVNLFDLGCNKGLVERWLTLVMVTFLLVNLGEIRV